MEVRAAGTNRWRYSCSDDNTMKMDFTDLVFSVAR